MTEQNYVQFSAHPELRSPILLAAFAGWNDAAQAATLALTTLLSFWSAQRFAEIDPEEFFVFTETRPTVTWAAGGQRSLHWPANAFFAHHLENHERDIVLFIGTEPQLKWRTFCRAMIDLATSINASQLITLGALLTEVPHTATPRISGSATDADRRSKLRGMGVSMSSYEGPTGILGALSDAWKTTKKPAVTLWGNVPHYISATPNPQVALALLERVAGILELDLPLDTLRGEATAFIQRIDEAVAENPEALEYVRDLEQQLGEEPPPPAGPELIQELEEFLRRGQSDETP